MSDGIIPIDEQGSIETCNPAAEAIFGYTSAEIVGQDVKLLLPEPDFSEPDHDLAQSLQTGHVSMIGHRRELIGRHKNGSTFPMELAVGEMHIGARRIVIGIVRHTAIPAHDL